MAQPKTYRFKRGWSYDLTADTRRQFPAGWQGVASTDGPLDPDCLKAAKKDDVVTDVTPPPAKSKKPAAKKPGTKKTATNTIEVAAGAESGDDNTGDDNTGDDAPADSGGPGPI